ncbi:MAG: hypothetical protein WDM86_05545 [Rhizomicrobium sp.]
MTVAAWFGPKDVGSGISPRGVAGWIALLVFLGGLAGITWLHRHYGLALWSLLAALAVWVVAFFAVVSSTYRYDRV